MYQSIHQFIIRAFLLFIIQAQAIATVIPLEDVCPSNQQANQRSSVVDSLTAGRYWDPTRPYQGYDFWWVCQGTGTGKNSKLPSNRSPYDRNNNWIGCDHDAYQLTLFWYTYEAGGSNYPVWFLGIGEVELNSSNQPAYWNGKAYQLTYEDFQNINWNNVTTQADYKEVATMRLKLDDLGTSNTDPRHGLEYKLNANYDQFCDETGNCHRTQCLQYSNSSTNILGGQPLPFVGFYTQKNAKDWIISVAASNRPNFNVEHSAIMLFDKDFSGDSVPRWVFIQNCYDNPQGNDQSCDQQKTELSDYFTNQNIPFPTQWSAGWDVGASNNLCQSFHNGVCKSYAEFFVREMTNGYNAYEDYNSNSEPQAQIIGRLIREYKKGDSGFWEAKIRTEFEPLYNTSSNTLFEASTNISEGFNTHYHNLDTFDEDQILIRRSSGNGIFHTMSPLVQASCDATSQPPTHSCDTRLHWAADGPYPHAAVFRVKGSEIELISEDRRTNPHGLLQKLGMEANNSKFELRSNANYNTSVKLDETISEFNRSCNHNTVDVTGFGLQWLNGNTFAPGDLDLNLSATPPKSFNDAPGLWKLHFKFYRTDAGIQKFIGTGNLYGNSPNIPNGKAPWNINFKISDLKNSADENLIPETLFSDFNNDTTFQVSAQAIGPCTVSTVVATDSFNIDVSPVADATVTPISIQNHQPGSGAIPGSGGVSGGSATYSLPLKIPPGRNGMMPELSVNYSSKGGNGVLGVGWSLSVNSSISRCPKTIAQDGVKKAIDGTNSDRLCLDGQRLIFDGNDTDPNYWNINATYRTEIESFSQVKRISSSAFEVKTKVGRTLTYEQLGNQTINWYITKEADSHSNNIVYEYLEHGENEWLVDTIRYTGTGNNAGTRRIEFEYYDHLYYNESYVAGEKQVNSQWLIFIKTFVDNTFNEIDTYKFTQHDSPASGKAILLNVEQFASGEYREILRNDWTTSNHNGSEWIDPNPLLYTFDQTELTQNDHSEKLRRSEIAHDFNGDGRKEYLYQATQNGVGATANAHMLFMNKDGSVQSVLNLGNQYGKHENFVITAQSGDVNADGYTDYLFIGDTTGTIHIATWKNNVELPANSPPGTILNGLENYFDIYDTGIGLQSTITPNGRVAPQASKVFLTDLNNDGKTDIIIQTQPYAADHPPVDSNEKSYLRFYANTSTFTNGNINIDFANSYVLLAELLYFHPRPIDQIGQGNVYSWESIDSFADMNGDGFLDFTITRRFFFEESDTNNVGDTTPFPVVAEVKHMFTQADANGNITMVEKTLEELGAINFNDCYTINSTTAEPCLNVINQGAITLPETKDIIAHTFQDINGDGLPDLLYYNKAIFTIDGTETINTNIKRNWKVRLNSGASINNLGNLFSTPTIESNHNNAGNLAFLPQGDICDEANIANATEEQRKLCHPVFRSRALFADITADGRPELLFPNPDPSRMYHNFCSLFRTTNSRGSGDPHPYDYLYNSSDAIAAAATAYNGIVNVSPNPFPQEEGELSKFLSKKARGNPSDILFCSTTQNMTGVNPKDFYATDVSFRNAIFDRGVYEFDTVYFRLRNHANGNVKLDVTRNDLDLYASISSPKVEDNNGDGLVEITSAWGCVDNYAFSCDALGWINGDAANMIPNFTIPSQFWTVGVGATITTEIVSPMPDLMIRAEKPDVNEWYEWDYNSISQLYDSSATPQMPYYALPERRPGNTEDGYIQDVGAQGEYFFFNSSMYVVGEMRASNGMRSDPTLVTFGPSLYSSTKYGYEEAVFNNQGRGFQGFRKIVVDFEPMAGRNEFSTRNVSKFHQVFPLSGRLERIETFSPIGSTSAIQKDKYTWTNTNTINDVYFTPLKTRTINNFAPNSNYNFISQIKTTNGTGAVACTGPSSGFDQWGNNICQVVERKDFDPTVSGRLIKNNYTTQTNSYYLADETEWWLDKLDTSTTTNHLNNLGIHNEFPSSTLSNIAMNHYPGGQTAAENAIVDQEKTVKTKYYWQNNQVRKLECTMRLPDGQSFASNCSSPITSNDELRTHVYYDSYGHQDEVVINALSNQNVEECRRNWNRFGTIYEGYFVDRSYFKVSGDNTSCSGSLRHTDYGYDLATGQVSFTLNPNGLDTMNLYDGYGRLYEQRFDYTDINGSTSQVDQPIKTHTQNCGFSNDCSTRQTQLNNIITAIRADANINTANGFYTKPSSEHPVPKLTYVTEVVQNGTPKQTTYYDASHNAVMTVTQHSGGDSVSITLTDPLGRTELTTLPFMFSGSDIIVNSDIDTSGGTIRTKPFVTVYEYDQLNRLIRKTAEVGNLTSLSSGGRSMGICNQITDYTHLGGTTTINANFQGSNCATEFDHGNASANFLTNNNLVMKRYYDLEGKLIYTQDADSNGNQQKTRYWYDPLGNPLIVQDEEGNMIVNIHDSLSRKTYISDPNMGQKTYEYNGFGDLVQERDGQQLESGLYNFYTYDYNGRLKEKRSNVNYNTHPTTAARSYKDIYKYDRYNSGVEHAVGKMYVSERYSNIDSSGEGTAFSDSYVFRKRFTYDEKSRLDNEKIQINDALGEFIDENEANTLLTDPLAQTQIFKTQFHYDANYNRIKQITYQGGFSVHNQYTQFGELQKQKIAHDPAASYLMQINAWNLQGQITRSEMNNGLLDIDYLYYPSTSQMARIKNMADNTAYEQTFTYKYDPWGNISHQKQDLNGLVSHEYLDYDVLHRLVATERRHDGSQPSGTNLPVRNDYAYDDLGNILYKSDFNRHVSASSSYGTVESVSNSFCDTAGTTTNPGPNAITRAGIGSNERQRLYYYYDHKGNRRIDCFLVDSSIQEFRAGYRYDADNLLIKAESAIRTNALNGGGLITFQNVEYRYGTDNQRYRKYDALLGEITLYGNKDYERIYDILTGEIQQKYYVTDYLTLSRYSNKPSTWHFLQKDRLGSTTLVTDGAGEMVHTRSYDPFGKPRNGDWSDQDHNANDWFTAKLNLIDPENPGSADISKRGFTGHEHLDNLQLIHMNGRMFDFNNGRFLSVDPFIQGATSQALNPYSYIQNNPLSGIDPTGYFINAAEENGEDLRNDPEEDFIMTKIEERRADALRNSTLVVVGAAVIEVAQKVDEISDYLNPGKGLLKAGAKKIGKGILNIFGKAKSKKATTNGKNNGISNTTSDNNISEIKKQDQEGVDSLIKNRKDKELTANATTSRTINNKTGQKKPIRESDPDDPITGEKGEHAEMKSLRDIEGNPKDHTIIVDQTPCEHCNPVLKKSGVRVVVPQDVNNPNRAVKNSAVKASKDKTTVRAREVDLDKEVL